MGKIKNVTARQIFDSRGNPTVEVDLLTDEGGFGRAAVPSGYILIMRNFQVKE